MYIYIDTLLLYFIVFKKLIMLLSILIPAYKVETLLSRCLDSIFCQDTSKVEIIIVDDGSPDKTFDVAKSYAEKYANLRVFRKENNGVGAARNFLFEKAIGDYIWFIDSDDYIENGFFNCLDTNNEDLIIVNSRSLSPSGLLGDSFYTKTTKQLHNKNSITQFLSTYIDSSLYRAPWAKFYKKENIKTY